MHHTIYLKSTCFIFFHFHQHFGPASGRFGFEYAAVWDNNTELQKQNHVHFVKVNRAGVMLPLFRFYCYIWLKTPA